MIERMLNYYGNNRAEQSLINEKEYGLILNRKSHGVSKIIATTASWETKACATYCI